MRTKIRRKQTKGGVRWYVFVFNDDGTESAHPHGGFDRQRDAKAAAEELLTDARRGRYVAPSERTLADYLLGEWIPSRQNADLSPNTRDTDRTVVEAWILPHVGDVPLQRMSAATLDRLYARLRASGGRGGKPLRGKSVRNAHVTLSKALGDAVRRGYLTSNPAAAVNPPSTEDSVERKAWSADEVRTFLDASSSDRLAAIWRFALATGLRRGELLGLQWESVDLDEMVVLVRREVLLRPRSVPNARRLYVRETTKTRRRRAVRFDRATAAAMRAWKADQAAERLAFGPAWHAAGGLGIEASWIVTEPDGAVIHPDTLLARWKRAVGDAGLPAITIQEARHSYAEVALQAGARLDVVQRQLGHSSIATTARYLHESAAPAAAVADLVGTLLDGDPSRARAVGEDWEKEP